MPRRRRMIDPPHQAIRRAIDAHAAIGAPPTPPELAAAEQEQAGEQEQAKPSRRQRRGASGRFA